MVVIPGFAVAMGSLKHFGMTKLFDEYCRQLESTEMMSDQPLGIEFVAKLRATPKSYTVARKWYQTRVVRSMY